MWAPFPADTDYFGRRDQWWMINFRVGGPRRDAGPAAGGRRDVDDDVQVMEGIGRFGWASDPEGNRFELWEPAAEALRKP